MLAFVFQYKQGKVGPDGKELIPQESPKVNGYGFVATPSPVPGKKRFFLLGCKSKVVCNAAFFHFLMCQTSILRETLFLETGGV